MQTPTLSVLMSTFNGEAYLETAVNSILSQTFTNFEFIIINDGSTDDTAAILQRYTDPRLRIFHQENIGLTRSLNRGIALASGRYIARMDSDDYAWPSRFAAQIAYLDSHPESVLLGTAYRHVDSLRHRTIDIFPPTHDADIRRAMLSGNPICHSSAMISRAALTAVGGYNEDFRYVQDYELWSRLAVIGQIANLPEILQTRYYHADSLSNNMKSEIKRLKLHVQANRAAIIRLGYPPYYQLFLLNAFQLLAFRLYSTLRYFMHQRLSSKGRKS
ncbi:MAG: glycosyltransferase [Chloroflexota bacterium]